MADNYLGYEEPGTVDKKLDTESLTVGLNTVHRERIQISGSTASQIAPVDGTAGLKVNLGADNDVTVTSGTITAVTTITNPVDVNTHAVSQSGTWTVQPGNTANTTAWKVDGSAVTQPVSAVSLPLPTGASTAAKQPALGTAGTPSADVITIQGVTSMTAVKVDGSGVTQPVSYATTGSGTATGALRVELPTNGTGVIATVGAVTAITNALPAGTNAIGKLAANTGVDIGDVDVTSIIPGTGATNLGKAIDTATGATDTGVLVLATRDDALSSLTPVEGDNVQLRTDANGALWVALSGSAAGDGAILDGVSGSIKATVLDYTNSNPLAVRLTDTSGDYVGAGAGTQYTEDAAAAADPVGTVPILVRKDTPAATVSTDGDNIAQRGTNYGAAYVTLLDTSGNPVAVGGGTQYTEDAAAAADPVGTALIMVRKDTLAALTSTDGDNVAARGTDKGELYVKHVDAIPVTDNAGSLTVDNGGTFAVQAAQSGTWTVQPGNTANTTAWKVDGSAVTQPISGTVTATIAAGAATIAKAEDAASADGDTGVACLAVRKATPANTSGSDGDYEFLQISAGRLWASATIDAALPAGTNAIGKLAANSGVDIGDVDVTTVGTITPGTAATSLGKAEDAIHGSGDVGVMALAVANEANTQFAADADYVPIGTNREGSIRAIGSRAHDAVDADGPVKVGHVAIAHGTNPTAVAAADRTNWYANRAGIPFFIGGHPNIVTFEAAYTAAQTDTAIVTVGAGAKVVVTQIQATCDNANTVDVGLRVGFGTANTPTTTGVVLTHPGIAAGSGISRGDGSGIIGVGADNEDLRITSEVPTTGSLRILVSYFTIES